MGPQSLSGLPPISGHDHALGATTPRVTLIEYGDFGCPYCFAAKRPVGSLVERYDAVRLVWRHFPNSELHPGADLAAELSEVGSSVGRFWDAHALLLAGRDRFTRADFETVAKALDLDRAHVRRALEERIHLARIRTDADGGEGAGVRATPTFFLNGRRLEGHWRNLASLVPRVLAESDPPVKGRFAGLSAPAGGSSMRAADGHPASGDGAGDGPSGPRQRVRRAR
jgi:protein-disulfide isomerase